MAINTLPILWYTCAIILLINTLQCISINKLYFSFPFFQIYTMVYNACCTLFISHIYTTVYFCGVFWFVSIPNIYHVLFHSYVHSSCFTNKWQFILGICFIQIYTMFYFFYLCMKNAQNIKLVYFCNGAPHIYTMGYSEHILFCEIYENTPHGISSGNIINNTTSFHSYKPPFIKIWNDQ